MTRDNGQIAAIWDRLYKFYLSQGYSDEAASQLANEGTFNICSICGKEYGGCEHFEEEEEE